MDNLTKKIADYSDKIMDIIDNLDDFSRGDLQGVIETQCKKMLEENNK